MKKKSIPPFMLTEGQRGRILFEFKLGDGAEVPELCGALMVHGQRVDMEAEDEGTLVIPVLPAGVYLAEVRAGGVCVLYGDVEVLPSPLRLAEGDAVFQMTVDCTTDVLRVSLALAAGIPGRRGAPGPQGAQGEQGEPGLSAYELACLHGYAGSEAEWVAAFEGAQAAAREAKTRAAAAAAAAREADDAREAAASDKAAAEQAKMDAQAAQTKAEQEAAKAEQNAAMLGDAALKSADNTFSGSNTFNGSITGNGDIGGVSLDAMIGADFRKYEWVETLEQLYAVCPNWREMETWYYHCPKLWKSPFQPGKESKKLKTFYWYSEAALIHEPVICISDVASWKCVIVLPNATHLGNGKIVHKGYPYNHDSTYELYAPNASGGKVSSYATPRRFKFVSKYTSFSSNAFQSTTGANNLQELDMPLNVLKSINLAECTELRQVLSPFPVATLINFNNAKLDAASALRIVNNLQPYDAETMTELPTLTIGIHIDQQTDEEVIAALDAASAAVEDGGQGWVVAVAWNGTATASTFALRPSPPLPVYAKVDTYTDEEGNEQRSLNWCHQISSPSGLEPEELGYTLFESVEAAREYFNLPEPVEYNIEEEE